ncbi:hypothetical protein BKP37_07220 [Anaerobacillus alkalilacustris]|uniref:Uncharacterized protein n=1 Tax=Anaerobacillus alkalilacustris TaxID=393763 RepID=A0A1S2LRL3_9BACI|nr:hypothetical protein [Anaerobacillus alkalilacustris]OIJ14763.1 hypothetical protein BKP37_07220 [Anaerobacillus alkalilacustris]
MNKENVIKILEERKLTDIIELIEDAETGDLEELELVKSVGLLYDVALNKEVIQLLQDLGVKIIYVTDEE